MNATRILGVLGLLLAGAAAGCATGSPVVRGQSPYVTADGSPVPAQALQATPPGMHPNDASQPPLIGSAPAYGQHNTNSSAHHDYSLLYKTRDHQYGFEGGYYTGTEGYYTGNQGQVYTNYAGRHGHASAGCPYCQYGDACPADGCPHCGCGCKGHPHHHHTYKYNWPQGLSYPQGPVPAGMVQYPYYTLRGPTDFFMK